MVTLEEISIALAHPFVILAGGAVISGVFVAWLTNRWQNHRKELEIKADIASKMLEVYGSVAAKIFLSRRRQEPISNIDEVLEKFCVDAYIVDSMLESYYSSEPDILTRWSNFFFTFVPFLDATSLYFVKDSTVHKKKPSLEDNLNKIKEYFSDNKKINLDGLIADKDYDHELLGKIKGLTADKGYDHELWEKIDDLYWKRLSKIYKDVLELPIKVYGYQASKKITDVLKLRIKVF